MKFIRKSGKYIELSILIDRFVFFLVKYRTLSYRGIANYAWIRYGSYVEHRQIENRQLMSN